MPDPTDFRLAADRFEQLAAWLFNEAGDLCDREPRHLGGEGPGFIQLAADLYGVGERLRIGGRALADVAAACRQRATEIDVDPVSRSSIW